MARYHMELPARLQADPVGEVKKAFRHARGVLRVELDSLAGGILDWGDPNDGCDPTSEYAAASRASCRLGELLERVDVILASGVLDRLQVKGRQP